jgi:hypothetical protein
MALSLNKKIMARITANLSFHKDWDKFENELIRICAKLPTYFHETNKKEAIDIIETIRTFLTKEVGLQPKELKFLDLEIEFIKSIKQTTLFESMDYKVPEEVIQTFCNLSYDTEGVLLVEQKFNFSQLKTISKHVFKETGYAKFYISNSDEYSGKILTEYFEHSQILPLMDVVENLETGEYELKFFNDKLTSKHKLIKRINVPFYTYRFLTHTGEQLMIFSSEKYNAGEATVRGTKMEIEDRKLIGETAKLSVSMPMLFCYEVVEHRPKFNSLLQLQEFMDKFRDKEWFNTPFMVYNDRKKVHYLYRYHDWFKDLIWAFHLHAPQGTKSVYPLHLMIVGAPGTGKSDLLDNLHAVSEEHESVFSGVSSTLLNLIPSFKTKIAEMGYLAKCSRFAYCDEFFRILIRNSNSIVDNKDTLGIMNDMLEHKKRAVGSGNSRINVIMTARMLGTSNPIWRIQNMNDMLGVIDNSFLSRLLVYFQSVEDEMLVKKVKSNSELEIVEPAFQGYQWLGFCDFMHEQVVDWDDKKLEDIFETAQKMLPETLSMFYITRQRHHLECLADGLIKLNILRERRLTFEVLDSDYDTIKKVWYKIISSWKSETELKEIPVKDRLKVIPEYSKALFDYIATIYDKTGKGIVWGGLKSINFGVATMTPNAVSNSNMEAIQNLIRNQLIFTEDAVYLPYYAKGSNNHIVRE